MGILYLAWKDLLQIGRDRKSAVFLIVLPVVFTFFLGSVFNFQGGGEDNRPAVGYVNLDQEGPATAGVEALLAQAGAVRPVPLAADQAGQAKDLVRNGDYAAVVIVPEGFGQALLAGQPKALTLVADENQPQGQTAASALRTLSARLYGAAQTARLSAEAFDKEKGFADGTARSQFLAQALQRATAAWATPPVTVQVDAPRWRRPRRARSPPASRRCRPASSSSLPSSSSSCPPRW
ncbi:MAG: ABC transporter permease [Chloroflexota bacterium]